MLIKKALRIFKRNKNCHNERIQDHTCSDEAFVVRYFRLRLNALISSESIWAEVKFLIVYNFATSFVSCKFYFLAMFHRFSQCDTIFIQCMNAFWRRKRVASLYMLHKLIWIRFSKYNLNELIIAECRWAKTVTWTNQILFYLVQLESMFKHAVSHSVDVTRLLNKQLNWYDLSLINSIKNNWSEKF